MNIIHMVYYTTHINMAKKRIFTIRLRLQNIYTILLVIEKS